MNTQTDENAMFGGDCPRCGQHRTTFDILASTFVGKTSASWDRYECFMLCRQCFRPSIGLLRRQVHSEGPPTKFGGQYINALFEFSEWIFEVPNRRKCPEHVPAD